MKAEFGRVMDDKTVVNSMTELFKQVWKPKLLKLAKKKTTCSTIVGEMEIAISEHPDKITGMYYSCILSYCPNYQSFSKNMCGQVNQRVS